MNLIRSMLIMIAVAGFGLFTSVQLQAAGEDMDRAATTQSQTKSTGAMGKSVNLTSTAISDIQGEPVKNSKGETLGEVDDLVIGPDGRVQYLVLARDEGLLKDERLFAIPWGIVQINEDADVVVPIDNAKLAQAPSFARDDWPDFDDSSVKNQYSGYFMGAPRQQGSEKAS